MQLYGAPTYLINRIIQAILHERTSVKWNGRLTTQHTKNRGVKQGCPISPYIFVLIMNYALQRACDRLNIDINLTTFSLPMMLAYADDIVIITDSMQSADNIFREFKIELQAIILSINYRKSDVMIRDLVQVLPPFQDTIRLNGKDFNIVTIMKYLDYLQSIIFSNSNAIVPHSANPSSHVRTKSSDTNEK